MGGFFQPSRASFGGAAARFVLAHGEQRFAGVHQVFAITAIGRTPETCRDPRDDHAAVGVGNVVDVDAEPNRAEEFAGNCYGFGEHSRSDNGPGWSAGDVQQEMADALVREGDTGFTGIREIELRFRLLELEALVVALGGAPDVDLGGGAVLRAWTVAP